MLDAWHRLSLRRTLLLVLLPGMLLLVAAAQSKSPSLLSAV